MEYNTKDLREGKHIGKEMYVCDFRYSDFNNKSIRHIEPKKVLCRSIDETTKRVNYSNCFFSEIRKDKIMFTSVIKLFDNTGFRSFPGVALKAFSTMDECVVAYREMAFKLEDNFERHKEDVLASLTVTEKLIQEAIMYERR